MTKNIIISLWFPLFKRKISDIPSVLIRLFNMKKYLITMGKHFCKYGYAILVSDNAAEIVLKQ